MKAPEYRIYWLISGPHCEKAKKVKQTDGKTAYVCKHNINKEGLEVGS